VGLHCLDQPLGLCVAVVVLLGSVDDQGSVDRWMPLSPFWWVLLSFRFCCANAVCAGFYADLFPSAWQLRVGPLHALLHLWSLAFPACHSVAAVLLLWCCLVGPVPLWHRGVGVPWRAAVRWHVVLVPARWGVLRIGWCAGWGRAGWFALVCCCCPRYCFLVCGFAVLTALLCCTVVLSGGYSLLVLMTLIHSCHVPTAIRRSM
jgi:hypothetical protein